MEREHLQTQGVGGLWFCPTASSDTADAPAANALNLERDLPITTPGQVEVKRDSLCPMCFPFGKAKDPMALRSGKEARTVCIFLVVSGTGIKPFVCSHLALMPLLCLLDDGHITARAVLNQCARLHLSWMLDVLLVLSFDSMGSTCTIRVGKELYYLRQGFGCIGVDRQTLSEPR